MRELSECSLLRIARLCHSERNEESPPFAKRKGAGGMPWQLVNCDGNDWNDGL